MLLEGIERKEMTQAKVTDEEILAEVSISVETRVTPYSHLSYEE